MTVQSFTTPRPDPVLPDIARVAGAIAVFIAFLELPVLREAPNAAYTLGAAVLTLLAVYGVVLAGREPPDMPATRAASRGAMIAFALAVSAAAASAAILLAAPILAVPVDANLCDMIPAIKAAAGWIAEGKNPYAQVVYLPWEVRAIYGPVIYAAYLIPEALGLDYRLMPLACDLVILCAVLYAACRLAGRGRIIPAWGLAATAWAFAWLLASGSFCLQTPVYWPLIFFYAVSFAASRYRAASVLLGLAVAARLNMGICVPIHLIYLFRRHKSELPACLALTAAAGIGPYLPFAGEAARLLHNSTAFYIQTMRESCWGNPEAMRKTFGVASPLLTLGASRLLGVIQALSLGGTALAGALSARTNRQALAWMGLSVFVLTLTTYVPAPTYFYDVIVLWLGMISAQAFADTGQKPGRALLASLPAALVLGAAAVVLLAPDHPVIRLGEKDSGRYLHAGFSQPEAAGDGLFAFRFVEGNRAEISLPRSTRTRASLRLIWRAFDELPDGVQSARVILNGQFLQELALPRHWISSLVAVPDGVWVIGNNALRLEFAASATPVQHGGTADVRRLAGAVSVAAVDKP